jgi:ribosome-associated heat shock protein Hsp15
MERLRLDKWLWAARFYKTRTLATDEVHRGRVQVNGQDTKPARDLKVGDLVAMRQGAIARTVMVRALSESRGPAPIAQTLYEETAESVKARAVAAEQRRIAPEPALAHEHGRPTKRERRTLDEANASWGDRWSASIDGRH